MGVNSAPTAEPPGLTLTYHMTTETITEIETDSKLDSGACWPPLCHLIDKREYPGPVKEGDIALCGAKLMGIDLQNVAVRKVCAKCIEEAQRRNI